MFLTYMVGFPTNPSQKQPTAVGPRALDPTPSQYTEEATRKAKESRAQPSTRFAASSTPALPEAPPKGLSLGAEPGPMRSYELRLRSIFLETQKTWILCKEFGRALDIVPIWNPMSILSMALLSRILLAAHEDFDRVSTCS